MALMNVDLVAAYLTILHQLYTLLRKNVKRMKYIMWQEAVIAYFKILSQQ
jgi:hypothetical protein